MRPFPWPGPQQTVSGAEGGTSALWTRDGRQIVYPSAVAGDNRILARDVLPGRSLRFGASHVAFALPFSPVGQDYPDRVFAIAPDGRRVGVGRPDPAAAPEIHSLTLIRHWVEEVKAKVAAGGR